jgi:hypothetical protein
MQTSLLACDIGTAVFFLSEFCRFGHAAKDDRVFPSWDETHDLTKKEIVLYHGTRTMNTIGALPLRDATRGTPPRQKMPLFEKTRPEGFEDWTSMAPRFSSFRSPVLI